jgi:excisionase family DNA binding protein
MENVTQLHNATPQQLTEAIINGVKDEISLLKAEFQPKEPTEYLTRNEVAQLLKVDLSTVHNWTKKGKIKAYGLGNRVYYKRHELNQSLIQINL